MLIVIFKKEIIWGHAQAYFMVFVVVALLVGVSLLLDLIFKRRHNNEDVNELVRKHEAPEDI